ncbi:MAG: 3-dehydroquinate synthase [Bacteroidetes bacterium]|nr:3-dehydroquinate synthase [Bacteroidota bacterium]
MLTQRIDVQLEKRSYPIYIGADLVSHFATACQDHGIPTQCVLVTDKHVAPLYARQLLNELQRHGFEPTLIIIPAGEYQKCLRRTNALYTELLERGISRKSVLIALGGGVIGDLVGFVAATYQRGVQLIHVPTTLLAQVDSSIGGKVGINHPLGKNMIGAFYQPRFVWQDVSYLSTLPPRELLCGIGEVVKYGIIRDAELFAFLESHMPSLLRYSREELLYAQSRCARIKAQVVSEDEYEQGVRVILNCGHTLGHALELAGKFKVLKHGEAVLLGLIGESYIAMQLGILDEHSFHRIVELIRSLPLKFKQTNLAMKEVFPAIRRDKKKVGKSVRYVLPQRIGTTVVINDVDDTLVREALRYVFSLFR